MAAVTLSVGDTAALTARDTWLQSRLTGLGHTVTLLGHATAPTSTALVLLSDSVNSSTISSWRDTVAAPVMSLSVAQAVHSQQSSQSFGSGGSTQQDAFYLTHPITDPTAGTTTIYAATPPLAYQWLPVASMPTGAQIFAYHNSGASRVVGFAFPVGATLNGGGTCPTRRVCVGIRAPEAANATALAIFDRAVTWAIGDVEEPPPAAPYSILSATGRPVRVLRVSGSGWA